MSSGKVVKNKLIVFNNIDIDIDIGSFTSRFILQQEVDPGKMAAVWFHPRMTMSHLVFYIYVSVDK